MVRYDIIGKEMRVWLLSKDLSWKGGTAVGLHFLNCYLHNPKNTAYVQSVLFY